MAFPYLAKSFAIFKSFPRMLLLLASLAHSQEVGESHPPRFEALYPRNAPATTKLLDVFQVYPPVLTAGANDVEGLTNGLAEDAQATFQAPQSNCVERKILMEHVFANSYENPFVGW